MSVKRERLSIIAFSGTDDKLYPVAILASGAAALGIDVEIFLTFWGLNAFRKDTLKTGMKISKDFEEAAPMVSKIFREKNVPHWYDMLKQAKELGNVKVYACAMTYDLFNMKREDLSEIIDGVVGVGDFLEKAKESSITLFI
ncbi:MAG: DsrE/DsrF/DrsH-like family protein [Aigarchaeota archaeon]|nr:DsrE/DsrF/DrsH-like family protein [Aigarchaeota archaeon]MCX8192261.1 DsrE/DsrF/DrsH-like family protein [Nitrososphaeria archaeon]MDW7986131.1 DsrE/DsrF/DrsH-like family protein [Nitrososphaerota archaeon]